MNSKSMLIQAGQENSGERAASQISANALLTYACKEEGGAVTSTMEQGFSKKCYILLKKQFFLFRFTFQNPSYFHCYSIFADFILTCGSVVRAQT